MAGQAAKQAVPPQPDRPRCPHCGAVDQCPIEPCLRNAPRALGNLLLLWLIAVAPFYLWRVCAKCDARFLMHTPIEHRLRCGKCSYNLTGNTSGVCPECGWKLPRRVRRLGARHTDAQSAEDGRGGGSSVS